MALSEFFSRLREDMKLSLRRPGFPPESLVYFITNRCNARCPHCFLWQSLNRDVDDELSAGEIKKMLAGDIYFKSVSLTGGEPTLRGDLMDIAGLFFSRSESLTLVTNGAFSDKAYAVLKELCSRGKAKQLYLQLSLEGLEKTHDAIRGAGSFAKVMETLEKVKPLEGVKIYLVTTLSRLNSADIAAMIEYFSKYGLEHRFNIARGADNSLFGLDRDFVNSHTPEDFQGNYLGIEEISSIYSLLSELNRKTGFWTEHNRLVMKYSLDILKSRKRQLRCYAGLRDSVLYPNGDVSFCEFMRPFANVRDFDYNLRALWRSNRVRESRRHIRDCCCIHSCNLSTSITHDPSLPFGEIKKRGIWGNFASLGRVTVNFIRGVR